MLELFKTGWILIGSIKIILSFISWKKIILKVIPMIPLLSAGYGR